MFKLVCGENAVTLGIEDTNGNWDYNEFLEHLKECPQCNVFATALLEEIYNRYCNTYLKEV